MVERLALDARIACEVLEKARICAHAEQPRAGLRLCLAGGGLQHHLQLVVLGQVVDDRGRVGQVLPQLREVGETRTREVACAPGQAVLARLGIRDVPDQERVDEHAARHPVQLIQHPDRQCQAKPRGVGGERAADRSGPVLRRLRVACAARQQCGRDQQEGKGAPHEVSYWRLRSEPDEGGERAAAPLGAASCGNTEGSVWRQLRICGSWIRVTIPSLLGPLP